MAITLPRQLGFRATLMLSFGVLCILMISALAFGLMRVIERGMLAEQGDALQSLSRSTSIMLAEGLQDRLREVRLLAESPEAARSGIDPAVWDPVLKRMQDTRPHFAWIGLTDAGGVVRASTGGMLQGVNVSARPWFQGAQHGVYLGDVHPAKLLADMLPRGVDGGPMRFVDFAAPLRAADGRLLGVLGVHGSWDWAHDVIGALRSPRARDLGVLVFILDAQGNVLHRPRELTDLATVPAAVRRLTAPGLLRWDDGVDYLTAATRLPGTTPTTALGWTIVVRQPAAQALQTAHQALRTAWWAGLLTLALGLAAVWWLAGRVSAPLLRIARAAQRVGEGDLHAGIPEERQATEVADLADSVRTMAATLVRQKTELQAANQDLEQRVAARTAELEAALAELARMARHDAVTGVYNRRGAEERLAQELALFRRHGTVFSILLADIDRFKQVNDQHGHDMGDQVLAETARRMGAACRRSDQLCRYGGEEFLLVMAHTDAPGAAAAAEKIRAQVAAAPIGPLQQVTVSIGVATAWPGLDDAAQMVKAADQALYAAKRKGRNRVELGSLPPAAGGVATGEAAAAAPAETATPAS